MNLCLKIILVLLFYTLSNTFGKIPTVTLSYAHMFDSVCQKMANYPIDKKWIDETINNLANLQKHWDKNGTKLLETTEAIIGKPFTELEISASLSVCSFPSMSNPLLINMRYSLKSFNKAPLNIYITQSIIFHEILHRYLDNKIPTTSGLLKKYKNEDETVLNHLHLLSLLKAVYLKLRLENTLQEIIIKDQSLPNKAYSRAWEIVNKLEDYNMFLRELK